MESLNGTWRGTINRAPFGNPSFGEILIRLQGLDRNKVQIISGYSKPADPACTLGDGSTSGVVSISGLDKGLDAQQATCQVKVSSVERLVSEECYFDASFRPGTTTIFFRLMSFVGGATNATLIIVEDVQRLPNGESGRGGWTLEITDLAQVSP